MVSFLLISLVILLICLSFIIGAAESALFSFKKWQIKRLAKKEGNDHLSKLGANQELISALAFGSTFINSFVIAISVILLIKLPLMYFIAFLCIIVTFISILCEILPKTLAIKSPQKWALKLAKYLFLFQRITKPIRFLAEITSNYTLKLIKPKGLIPNKKTTEEEFAELIDLAYQQGVLEKSEREIMEEIIKLDKRTAEEVMKPRSAMICIEDNISVEEMIFEAKKHRFTRLPIFHDKPDNIVGILNTRKLLLNPNIDLSESIEFPSYVPATMNLMDLLKSLRMKRRGLAIVVDEFGGTAGLITIEDVLEELVGEMREEGEKTEFTIEKLNKNRWRVNGTLQVEDFQTIEPKFKGLKEIDTMGGLITALKEVVPNNGESAEIDGYALTVVSGDSRRVKELVVKKLY
jgi:putative hemolysin